MRIVFAFSQFSLAVALVVPRLNLAGMPGWIPLDFLVGFLTGLSLVGNLASLIYFGRRTPFREGRSDD